MPLSCRHSAASLKPIEHEFAPERPSMSDIFICYSRTDSAVATKLTQHLRAEGWSVFLDVHTHVGKRWHKEIEKELHAAKAIVALWSAISRDSDFVLEEAEYGKRKGILFPAFIEQVEFPYGFGRIQTADLIGWNAEPDHPGLAQLLESLQLQLSPDQEPATHPPVRRAQPIAATALEASRSDTPASRNRVAPIAAEALEAVQSAASRKSFRDPLKVGGEGPLMVVIPAGRYHMGSPPEEPERSNEEGPQHEVRIARPFAMGVHAVTFDDYDRYCRGTKSKQPGDEGWGRADRPVINVSWEDAQGYCKWLSAQTGRSYRLPSEAEWEYACRAGTTTPFHFGARIATDQANFDGNSTYNGSAKGEYREQTVPVGSLPPNAFGLYEMHGNVWEWCQDAWHDNYQSAPNDGSDWEATRDVSRVLRGGSWGHGPWFCRAAFRNFGGPDYRYVFIGFRVCCSSPIE